MRGWVEALDDDPTAGAMVPVIVSEAPPLSPQPPTAGEVVLVSPRGFRLEGLSVSAAITALERLG